ncbi:LytTR family transcriptional regulator [Clostridiaceae bacterium]|nr:LytTR family transcriptional regulator [Clostridiaceae bacterium]RKI13862.1 LytTR family transcriptional regulator [bacterium 1XD21-70]
MKSEKSLKFTDLNDHQHHIYPHDIFYVEADNIRSWIMCEGQAIHVPHPILFMENLLPDYFLRIHRSFLVNQYSITALYPHAVMMSNGFRLPVPKKKYQWLKSRLEDTGFSTEYPRLGK